ncbi:MAG: hypothetical protein L6Q83_09740 [Gammaproteobacteria bacterium]|nr:hypothetical protein [Gammaproteobacteria bacterium]
MRMTGLALVAGALLAGGCSPTFVTPSTYNRHRYSEITLPRDGGQPKAGSATFFFDVSLSAEFPEEGEAAEAERMKWLEEWLHQRSMCLAGFEIVNKRRFDFMEDNPARRDLRYEVRCKAG